MYNVDFSIQVNNLLPAFQRKVVTRAWLEALLSPIADNSFYLNFFSQIRFDASITGQTMYLEYMLNKIFYNNGLLREIFIANDPNQADKVFIFNASEEEDPLYIFNESESEDPQFIFNAGEAGTYDFVVVVPDSVVAGFYDYIYSLVKKFKLAGPSFTILTYTEYGI